MSRSAPRRRGDSAPISCERAWRLALRAAEPLPAVELPLARSAGLVLAESVRAPMAVPPFANSAMDGFAVRARDIAAAGPKSPVRLEVVAVIAAGDHWLGPLGRGQAAKIMTGAPIPRGADTIVRQEDTRSGDGWVEILAAKPRGEAVRARGSDLAKGRVALRKGTRLGPAELSTLAMVGSARVSVIRRPRVALISSGSELKRPGTRLRPGEIYESSSWALAETLRSAGVEVEYLGVARDDRAETRRMIRRGLRTDMLLTAGGVSVGEFDYVRDEMRHAGVEEIFWRVAQRPGKPLLFAVRGSTLAFGLPGNPVSSLVSMHMHVLPAVRRMMGLRDVFPPRMRFPAAAPMSNPPGLRTFHRVSFTWIGDRLGVALTNPDQRSGVFSSMLDAHALTNLPPASTDVRRGEEIECFVLDTEALARAMSE